MIPQRGLQIEPPGARHNRANFSCGIAELDLYLQRQARQDSDRNLAAVFVLTDNDVDVRGLYTLSSQSILAMDLPQPYAKKLPRFRLPVTLLGRMAVSRDLRGQGLGEFLLMHALERCLIASRQIASWAVIVDAKAGARDFYSKHNFEAMIDDPNRLFLTMATIGELFSA